METYTITFKSNHGFKQTVTLDGSHILKVLADFYDNYGYESKILIIDCE